MAGKRLRYLVLVPSELRRKNGHGILAIHIFSPTFFIHNKL